MHRLLSLALIVAAIPLPGGGARATDAAAGEPHFVPMDEVTVPIVESDRVNGALRFKLVLEAADAPTAERLTASLPTLRAAALGAALDFARLSASARRPVDAGRLDRDLSAAIRRADAGVARVLIVEVAAQPS